MERHGAGALGDVHGGHHPVEGNVAVGADQHLAIGAQGNPGGKQGGKLPVGDGAVIAAGAVLSKHARVGPGEVWAGVPARRVGRLRRPAGAGVPGPPR